MTGQPDSGTPMATRPGNLSSLDHKAAAKAGEPHPGSGFGNDSSTFHDLLMVRAGRDYFRFTAGSGTPCGIDRASVFPPNRLEEVLARVDTLRRNGFPGARAVRLHIRETPV